LRRATVPRQHVQPAIDSANANPQCSNRSRGGDRSWRRSGRNRARWHDQDGIDYRQTSRRERHEYRREAIMLLGVWTLNDIRLVDGIIDKCPNG